MSRFSPEQRLVFGALADVLIPAAEGMPSATEVGVAADLLDQVANVRSDIVPDLLRVIRRAGGQDPAAVLPALKAEDPDGFAALGLAVAGGYYLSPRVRDALGYTGPRRQPAQVDTGPDFVDLLEPVIRRGSSWRSAPEGSGPADHTL